MSKAKCPFPAKDQLSRAEATRRAAALNGRRWDGRAVVAYRCPAGGHSHVGHRPVTKRKKW